MGKALKENINVIIGGVLVAAIIGGFVFYRTTENRLSLLERDFSYLKEEIQEDRKRFEKIECKLDKLVDALHEFKIEIIKELRKKETKTFALNRKENKQ